MAWSIDQTVFRIQERISGTLPCVNYCSHPEMYTLKFKMFNVKQEVLTGKAFSWKGYLASQK